MIAIDHSGTLEYKSYSILLLNLFNLHKNNGISFVCVGGREVIIVNPKFVLDVDRKNCHF